MGVAIEKIMHVVILSFEVALQCELTNIVIFTQKSKQTSMRENVILQSHNKKKRNEAVIYTCRYCGGHFDPYNSVN